MVDINWLLDKKSFYEGKQKEIEGKDYEPIIADLVNAEREAKEKEIEEYLEKFEEGLKTKYLEETKEDLQRVKHYIELLDEEIVYVQNEEEKCIEQEQEAPEGYAPDCEECYNEEERVIEYDQETCQECQIQ